MSQNSKEPTKFEPKTFSGKKPGDLRIDINSNENSQVELLIDQEQNQPKTNINEGPRIIDGMHMPIIAVDIGMQSKGVLGLSAPNIPAIKPMARANNIE